MKFMKIILCMLLMVGLIFSLTSCIPGFSVDKDGNMKIKGEDGDIEIGKSKWNVTKMYGLDAPKAKLESYVSSEDGTIYIFSEMKEKDAEEYINKIKAEGFTYSSVTVDDYSYTGTNKDGKTISFTYDSDSEGGTITAVQGEKPDEDDENGAVIGGKDKEWYSDKMGGLPDPGVAVVAYWTVDGDTAYTLEKMDNHLEYVEEIKSCGFTVDPSVLEADDTYIYTASNEDGDIVTFSSSEEAATITFEKND